MGEIVLTPAGRLRIESELEQLRSEHQDLLTEHQSLISENDDREDADRERELLEYRIARLELRLQAAEVARPVRDGEIDIGERATVIDLATGATTRYRIVGSGESDPAAGEISHDSPVGSALLGRRVGDVVEVETPGGVVRLEVVAIDE